MMMKKSIFILLLLTTASSLFAQEEYVARVLITQGNDTLHYKELLPDDYNPQARYPLVLFLHGAGERGSDNQAQLTHGSRMFTNPVNRGKYPAIVLFPQCPKEKFWSFDRLPERREYQPGAFPANGKMATPLRAVKELLDQYMASGKVDLNRIYVMGLSMGGMGTFDLVCRYPDLFAAAVPICGGVNPERLQSTAGKVKFRIFHGDRDNVVPVENSRACYVALIKFGADVRYEEIVGCAHDSWTPAFNMPDFLSWIFEQSK